MKLDLVLVLVLFLSVSFSNAEENSVTQKLSVTATNVGLPPARIDDRGDGLILVLLDKPIREYLIQGDPCLGAFQISDGVDVGNAEIHYGNDKVVVLLTYTPERDKHWLEQAPNCSGIRISDLKPQ